MPKRSIRIQNHFGGFGIEEVEHEITAQRRDDADSTSLFTFIVKK